MSRDYDEIIFRTKDFWDYSSEEEYSRIVHCGHIAKCDMTPEEVLARLNAGQEDFSEHGFVFFLARGDEVRFQRVTEITLWQKDMKSTPGSERWADRPVHRSEKVVSSTTLKLWKTKKRGYYFIEQ